MTASHDAGHSRARIMDALHDAVKRCPLGAATLYPDLGNHDARRVVDELVLAFADEARQSLTAREPATADVGREDIAQIIRDNLSGPAVQDFDMQQAHQADVLTTADKILAALSRAAPSSGHAIAEGERLGGGVVFYRRGGYSVSKAGEPFPPTADAYTFVPLTDEQIAALATTPPTTNDAIPAGMVRWDGGDRAPDDWDGGDVLLEDGTMGDGNVWDHHPSRAPTRIIAYTPKPSPTPKGSLPGRGEVDEPTLAMMEAGYDATRLKDGTPQFANAGFCLGHARTIYVAMRAEAIRDGGEGGEAA